MTICLPGMATALRRINHGRNVYLPTLKITTDTADVIIAYNEV